MSQQKRQQFSRKIRSEQRWKLFESERKRLQRAKAQGNQSQMMQAEMFLMNVCQNQEQYNMLMSIYDELEQKQRKYDEYLDQLGQESSNFQLQQKREEIKKIKRQMLDHFQDEY